ncbi:DNA repair protein RecO [Heyndrickxia shackletonii]|uniref:DNA repair protein RecO n=1 Tax=Heyndrickxia shackletonii TaxID=157838 RepID=A0A0Q3TIS5_9BACI|nr:DNA repair protein RecO [Heyndrickxia shackletonii]KQL53513.1 DNA repair protein RecO [Heyndrickxia shackletonii]MBB2480101.1 DNA repair protein RecO [Bacillus sp. APMAM]NEY99591.1 DNA repair protein RecO [Heyndrickxia shackletonii]RTZ56470.1 DNA repair protein RecO [Bacillus sp. SAJ1]
MLQKCEGIVIRTHDYGESNKIINVYTREFGKLGMMARGAKKPNSRLSAVSQLFTYGYFLVQTGNGLGTLQQGEMISSMRSIREDIFQTAYASYIVDLLDKSVEERQKNPFLFELLYQTLNYINEDVDIDIITNIFEMKMLNVLGLYPVMNQCAICGSKNGNFAFSIRENGLICHRCFEKDPYLLPVSQSSIRLLRLFYYIDINRLGSISVKPETKKELRRTITMYYDEYSGLQLKSKKFLDQIDKFKDIL